MRVVWADEARAHLAGIHDFIKRDAPFYATQTIDKLTRRVEQLIDHPLICKQGVMVEERDDVGDDHHGHLPLMVMR